MYIPVHFPVHFNNFQVHNRDERGHSAWRQNLANDPIRDNFLEIYHKIVKRIHLQKNGTVC